ncbi:glycosyltransferase [Lapidilactobacillus mulanensis]|uniref:Glycosyltransferase n=1 Tax=Lapidilactobacillus mulanensis TaxID=2485999 RepID=A0ABW4DRH5_9LACO|nr:glycosyltransferase [Lapidilactobacillus mulanensis]
MLSVLMSVYNEDRSDITESIDSILGQSYKDFELVIVLDNPKACNLKELLTDYAATDKRVKLIVNIKNAGLAQSMNIGAKYCSGEYIVRMDADDVCDLNRLQVLSDEINEHRNADVFYSRFRTITPSGELLKESPPIPTDEKKLKKILTKYKNIICHPTVAVKSSSLKKVGGYSNLRIVEDYELWLAMLRQGFVFYGIDQTLVDVRLHKNSMTTSNYYKSYLALEYIKTQSNKNSRVSNQDFSRYYQRKSEYAQRYNYFAIKYFQLTNSWGNQSRIKYVKLLGLLIAEPKLIRYCYETYRALSLRKASKD